MWIYEYNPLVFLCCRECWSLCLEQNTVLTFCVGLYVIVMSSLRATRTRIQALMSNSILKASGSDLPFFVFLFAGDIAGHLQV